MTVLTSARSGPGGQLILLSIYYEKKLLRTNSLKLKSPFLADVTQHLIGLCLTALYSTTIYQLPWDIFSNKITWKYLPVS